MKCRNCDNKKVKLSFEKEGMPYFKCSKCNIWFSGKSLDNRSIKELYKYYSSTKSTSSTEINELRYDALLSKFEYYRKTSRLLDVGCGRGDLIRIAKKKGWQAIGSEFSFEAIDLCKKNDLKVVWGKLSEINFPEDYFDVICMQEVVEHIDEKPSKTFKEVIRILRPEGVLYITTPNVNSLTRYLVGAKWRAFHVEHRFLFTPHIIREMLGKNGFRICLLETKNVSLNEIKKNILSLNHNATAFIRQEEQKLRKKIEKNKFLIFLKYIANRILNSLKIGDTILVMAEKRKHERY